MIISPIEVTLKNSTKLILRSVLSSEAGIMLDHLKISHGESYRNLNRGREFWEDVKVEEEAKILEKFETAPMQFMLGAFDGDRIVAGLGVFGNDNGYGRFSAHLGISIQRAFCNSGLGTAMMKYAISKAKECGLHRIELSVRTYNPEGIALYEKLGFRRIGLLKEVALIDGKFEDEWLYELILT